jgi:hypothetical protein
MSQTQRAWDVIPLTAKAIGLLVPAGSGVLIRFAALPADPNMRHWQEWQKDLFSFCVPLILLFYILLVGYVYGDAKRRYMRHVMWTLIAALVPNAIGVILYFVLRDPLPVACPNCQTPARLGFTYCPKCGTAVKRSCEGCGRAVEVDWTNCAYCGRKLGSSVPLNS